MYRFIIFWFLLLISYSSKATHNRAGEITYKYISELTYEFTIVTYTYSQSPADRPSLEVEWGDGTSSIIPRLQATPLPNYVNLNIYKGIHSFSGQGTFTISIEDPNRNGGISNIPGSINVPFYIETKLNISPFIGPNNSPTLLNPPIDNGCVGFPFYHNPGAYDIDGDSISFELIHCKGANGKFITGYTYPQSSKSFTMDAVTGNLSWENPIKQGEYNVAFLIKEYRNGFLIGTITRDMQITIGACNNRPPVIEELIDTCIEAGSSLDILIKASDIDDDNVTLRATGGPIILDEDKAIFPQPVTGKSYVQSNFSWQTTCNHVQQQPYQMIFKATDDGLPINLVDIKTLFITVVAPSPKNLTATPKANKIELNWDPSICNNAIGYDIYRRNGYIGFIPSNCETGVPSWTAYKKIGSTIGHSNSTYIDDNDGLGLILGKEYCYIVVAKFADKAESYASLEACTNLIKDIPVITNVSIDSTGNIDGETTVIWSKPDSIDYEVTPGPFKYLIHRNTTGIGMPMELIDSLEGLNDTIYHDKELNTATIKYFYKIEFVNNTPNIRFSIGNTQTASSIYLTSKEGPNKISLSWNEETPWNNSLYIIYKKNKLGLFDSIGQSSHKYYTDSNLVNNTTYCYKIKSIGEYSSPGFVKPLINWSQEYCASPVDNESPCAPILNARTDCQLIENYLIWDNPNNRCAEDVTSYNLYYTSNFYNDYSLIYSTQSSTDTSYIHSDIDKVIGCYYVIAIDSFGNESAASNLACIDIDSCKIYSLPNVFTPNGDNNNDFFTPFPYDLVEKVNMKIFNRWGILVYSTNNPDILWDGKDINSKKDCSEGVYFYVCEVFEYHIDGIKTRTINGSVSLYR